MSEIPARERIEAVRLAAEAEVLAAQLSRWNPLRWTIEALARFCRWSAADDHEDGHDWY